MAESEPGGTDRASKYHEGKRTWRLVAERGGGVDDGERDAGD